jgi:hypothetical protein
MVTPPPGVFMVTMPRGPVPPENSYKYLFLLCFYVVIELPLFHPLIQQIPGHHSNMPRM